jgi:CheY-like chemotaxis protein
VSTYLIVDDNEAFADNLAEILQDAGHVVSSARSGSDALTQVRGRRFDALLTDMRMPAMTGAQLVHKIRQVDPGLPAIVVTAYSGTEDLLTARNEGLLAVLAKPLVVPHMMELLAVARRDGLIALVEDDADYADNLTEALRLRGFTTVLAASVLDTERLASIRPFAGVVDLRVPGGPDGAAMARLAERFPGLPLIAVTGHDIPPPVETTRHFRKPVPMAELLEALEGLYEARPSRV